MAQLTQDTYRRLVAAKMFIDLNLHERIDLQLISKRACFSPFHFHRLFARIYRKTPHQYLTSVRLNAAKDLLKNEQVSVTEVCERVGFESPASFSLLFKKGTGLAPHHYRNQAFRKKQQIREQPKKVIPSCFVQTWNIE